MVEPMVKFAPSLGISRAVGNEVNETLVATQHEYILWLTYG